MFEETKYSSGNELKGKIEDECAGMWSGHFEQLQARKM